MKFKRNLILLILIFIMIMSGCTNSENIDETVYDESMNAKEEKEDTRFVYTIESKTLVKYDIVEQKATVACPNPLCEHDTHDCPVSDIYHVHITNDYIAFVKEDEIGWAYELYLYDLNNNTVEPISTNDENAPLFQIYYPWVSKNRDYVFFTSSIMYYDDNGNSIGEVWYVFRYNIASKELETINNGEKISTAYRVIQDAGDRLLWYCNLYGTYFWSDYEYGNIEEYDYPGDTVGNYYIYSDISYTEYDDYYRTMYRQDVETGDVALIADYVSEMRYDDMSNPTGIAYTLFNYIDEYEYNAKSEIWYYDCDTLENRLLIDVKNISDDFDYVHIQAHAGYNDSAGGYMMVSIGHTYTYINDDDEEVMSVHYTHKLFINPETGDWFIMEPLY